MNADDAAERGLVDGYTVLITSRHGKCLRRVSTTQRVIPGVVILGQGAWPEIDEATGIDKAGSVGVLIGDNPSGQGIDMFQSCNVQVEKWTGEPLEPDHKWPLRVIKYQ